MMVKIGQTLTIGAKHEHNAREFAFDVSKWRGMWPDAQANVLMQRPGEKVGYPAISRDDGDSVTWTVTRYDTAIAGVGEMRIVFTRGDELLGMTPGTTIRVETAPDLIAGDTTMSDTPPWVQKVLEAAAGGEETKNAIEELRRSKVNQNQGAEHAGKLLYVAEDGSVTPLTLGAGLEIVDGVLTITYAPVAAAICGQAVCGNAICGG